jgi:acid phosphatase type 7
VDAHRRRCRARRRLLPVSCVVGSAQEAWLRDELEALPDDACVLAYWHHPRYSSGWSGVARPHPELRPVWDALQDHGAELALTAHAHNYERFAPMDEDGNLDPAGLRQFVVGTGGRSLFADTGPQQPGSERLDTTSFGVLEVELAPGSYGFRFVREDGAVLDQGSGSCHDRPA